MNNQPGLKNLTWVKVWTVTYKTIFQLINLLWRKLWYNDESRITFLAYFTFRSKICDSFIVKGNKTEETATNDVGRWPGILPASRRLIFPLLHACKGNRRRLHASNAYPANLEPGQKCSNATTGYSYKRSNRVLSWIYRLNEKSRVVQDYEFPRGIRGHAPPPRNCFEMNMRWDAIWCILRHKFEKGYSGILF